MLERRGEIEERGERRERQKSETHTERHAYPEVQESSQDLDPN